MLSTLYFFTDFICTEPENSNPASSEKKYETQVIPEPSMMTCLLY